MQSRLSKVLILLIVAVAVLVIGTFIYDVIKSNDLKAKAARWTTITPPGADAGMKFVACKTPQSGAQGGGYDVTIVAAKDKSLQLTKRDADGKPLSTNPPMPQVFFGTYYKTTQDVERGYRYKWTTANSITTPDKSRNLWWNNEVTAIMFSKLPKGGPVEGNHKLLVYGMSDKANAPTFRRSGSGQVFVTGGFSDVAPEPENYSSATAYRRAVLAWEAKVPTVSSLVNCQ